MVTGNRTDKRHGDRMDAAGKPGYRKSTAAGRALLILAAAIVLFAAAGCSKKPGGNGTGENPSSAVTPTAGLPDSSNLPEDDGTEPALRPEAQAVYQLQTPAQGDLCAEFVFANYGTIRVRLFSEEARKAVENFKTLAGNGFYDGIKVGRVVDDYMVQAGDREGQGVSGTSIYGGGFEDEISEQLRPLRGALCMANLGRESTNSIQFFFVQTKASVVRSLRAPLDNRFHMTLSQYLSEAYGTELDDEELAYYEVYGGAPWLYGHNTVFGQIYEGYEVLDSLMKVKVTSRLRPNPPVFLETVRLFHYGEK